MAFYDLTKDARKKLTEQIRLHISTELHSGKYTQTIDYFSDEDTYIRKAAYLSTGRIFLTKKELSGNILSHLENLFSTDDFKIRQTVVNAAGEIGKTNFEIVNTFFERGLFDTHHSVRNAVIGSIKKMGEKNPEPVLKWCRQYLHHEDKEIRREICHGIELRGRTHPQDILPMLRELQHDKTARVRNTLVHVIGQISYKKGCLATVVEDLKTWENKEVVKKALEEIIDVHERYKNFSVLTQTEARAFIHKFF